MIDVKVLEVDKSGKIRLSRKEALQPGRRGARGRSARRMRTTRLANGVRVLSEELPGRRLRDGRHLGRERLALRDRGRRPGSRTSSSTSSSRAPSGGRRRRSPRRSTPSAACSTPSPARSTPATTRKVLSEHLPLALDLLADIFLHSRFAEDEIDRERTVVLQEISQVEDTPDDYVHDLFNLAFWPGHPLSRPIAGTAATVGALPSRRTSSRFIEARYRPNRILIAARRATSSTSSWSTWRRSTSAALAGHGRRRGSTASADRRAGRDRAREGARAGAPLPRGAGHLAGRPPIATPHTC